MGLILVDVFAASVVFLIAGDTVRREIHARITDDVLAMERLLREEGEEGLARHIRILEGGDDVSYRITGLFRADGTWVAGDLRELPPFVTDGRFSYDRPGPIPEGSYYAVVVRIGDHLLVVGRTDRVLAWTERVLLPLLVATSLAGVLLILFFLQRADRELGADLDRLDRTLRAFVAGEEKVRVPIDPAGERDSLQEIGRKVNANLDALTHALATLRNTTAAVAHDLRRPLVRASLAIQAASNDSDLPSEAAEKIALAEAELDGLNQTFETILRITSLAHRGRETFAPVDLGDLLREMADTFEPLFDDRGGRLDAVVPEEPLVVLGDRAMLAQALVNLIGNVLRHCPPGTSLRLSAGRQDGAAWVEVADDGPGVPPEALQAIFRPFERLDPSRHMDGAGLGLALAEAVARAHGAQITARNGGPGLVVRLLFPAEASLRSDT